MAAQQVHSCSANHEEGNHDMPMSVMGLRGRVGRNSVRGACGLLAALAAIAGAAGCGTSDNQRDDESVANFPLTIALAAVGDVESTRFEITPVDCGTGSATG